MERDATPESGEPLDATGSIDELAAANRDATWGETDGGRAWVPGVISGDVGPKGRMSAQLRHLSRTERTRIGEVPRGTSTPGTGRYLLVTMLGAALVLLALAVLVGWLAS